MSERDLWTVIGRAKTDLVFSGRLLTDLDGTVRNEGYDLSPEEFTKAREQIFKPMPLLGSPNAPPAPNMPFGPPTAEDIKFQKELMRSQMSRVSNLWTHVTEGLKGTLTGAAQTYRLVTWMNTIMFGCGLGLFVFASVYGVISRQLLVSAVFGGLGVGTFVSLFLLGAIDKTQSALSNLVQVGIIITNYLEQVTFWEAYAQRPEGFPPAPSLANIQKASDSLHQKLTETIELLEKYVETPAKRIKD